MIKKFNNWFDNINGDKRFIVFVFMIMIPFAFCNFWFNNDWFRSKIHGAIPLSIFLIIMILFIFRVIGKHFHRK